MIGQEHEHRFLSTEHLGTEAIAAFVDGELSDSAERRAQAHLMACPECRREVAHQRLAARRLRNSAALHIPSDVRARIASLAGNCELENSTGGTPTRRLAHRRPESLGVAVEQIVRGLRRGGSR